MFEIELDWANTKKEGGGRVPKEENLLILTPILTDINQFLVQ